MRDFGSLTAVEANTVSYSSQAATVTFELPNDVELLVLGVQAGGDPSSVAKSLVVRSLKYRAVDYILGDVSTAASPFIAGVPFRFLGAAGNNQYPKWHGDDGKLESLMRLAAETEATGTREDAGDLLRRAWSSLQRFSNQERPKVAGFIVSGDNLTMEVTDITSGGTDSPTNFTLLALVLNGQERRIGPARRGDNAPWWFAHTYQALATTSETISFGAKLQFLIDLIGDEGVIQHLESRAAVYTTSSGALDTNELHKVSLGTDKQDTGQSPFFKDSVPLSAFADGGDFPMFNRVLRDKRRLGWVGESSGVTAASNLYVTDYLLSLAG